MRLPRIPRLSALVRRCPRGNKGRSRPRRSTGLVRLLHASPGHGGVVAASLRGRERPLAARRGGGQVVVERGLGAEFIPVTTSLLGLLADEAAVDDELDR